MKKFSALVLIASAFLFACNSSDTSTETEGTSDSTMQSTPPPANADGSVQASSTDNSGAMTTPPVPAPAPASMPPPAPQQVATAPGMNPPHGQPGHRCDIAVGAPLNSPPATPGMAPTPNVVTAPGGPVVGTPQVISAPPPPATTATAPGMNPPHGQPGHDCAVAVGAPLPKK